MNDKPATATAAALFAAGAFALMFGQGHWPNGGALLVGIILWIRFFRVAQPRIAVPLVSVANVVIWEFAFAGMVPLPTAIRIGMFAGISLTFALLYLAFRRIVFRLHFFLSDLARCKLPSEALPEFPQSFLCA